jgi:hypothetical protein
MRALVLAQGTTFDSKCCLRMKARCLTIGAGGVVDELDPSGTGACVPRWVRCQQTEVGAAAVVAPAGRVSSRLAAFVPHLDVHGDHPAVDQLPRLRLRVGPVVHVDRPRLPVGPVQLVLKAKRAFH